VRRILNDSRWSKTVEIERFNLRAPAGAQIGRASWSQALVTADEKELKFVTRTETIEIKASFELERMINPQGMDL
jgi:hypothetical protein